MKKEKEEEINKEREKKKGSKRREMERGIKENGD